MPVDFYIVLTAAVICIFLSQPTCMRQVNSYHLFQVVSRRQVWGADIDSFLRRAYKRAFKMKASLTPWNAWKQNSVFAFSDYLITEMAVQLRQVLSEKKTKICKQDYGTMSAVTNRIWVWWWEQLHLETSWTNSWARLSCHIIMLATGRCRLRTISFRNDGGMATTIFIGSYCTNDGKVLVKAGNLRY